MMTERRYRTDRLSKYAIDALLLTVCEYNALPAGHSDDAALRGLIEDVAEALRKFRTARDGADAHPVRILVSGFFDDRTPPQLKVKL